MEIASLAIKIARSENLPVVPQVVGVVLRMTQSDDASLLELGQALEKEVAISSKVLKAANSAYYGMKEPVHSITSALQILGLRTVCSLVLSVAYQQAVSAGQSTKLFDRVEFWRHSLASAVAARLLARLETTVDPEEMYAAALFHDVGMLALDRYAPGDFDKALALSKRTKVPLGSCLCHVLGFDTSDVGGVLAERWMFGDLIRDSIQFHSHPLDAVSHQKETCMVAVAHAIAVRSGCPNQSPEDPAEIQPEVLELAGVREDAIEILTNATASEVARAQDAFKIR